MSDIPTPSITVTADATNPGQFFACCGLLELADRLWPGAEGWFARDDGHFCMHCAGELTNLIGAIANAELTHLDPSDLYSSPISIGRPFRRLSVDWWVADPIGAKDLKVWAGTMESYGIAHAIQQTLRDSRFGQSDLLDIGTVVSSSTDPSKKREPYYFDARRAPNAHSRDVGFSPNDLQLTTIAFPAVELLCLVGLQAARPASTDELRVYQYCTWSMPLSPSVMLAASSGVLKLPGCRRFRFEVRFRTGQKKHKAFSPAVPCW